MSPVARTTIAAIAVVGLLLVAVVRAPVLPVVAGCAGAAFLVYRREQRTR